MGHVVSWDELGAYRARLCCPPRSWPRPSIPRVRALPDQGDVEALSTVEAYLDNGCDAKATAEQLHLHRTTLSYRLHKLSEAFGLDLRSGEERLALHLGLKLARLAGAHPG